MHIIIPKTGESGKAYTKRVHKERRKARKINWLDVLKSEGMSNVWAVAIIIILMAGALRFGPAVCAAIEAFKGAL